MDGNGAVEIFGLCGAGKTALAREMLLISDSEGRLDLRPEFPVKPNGWVSAGITTQFIAGYACRDPLGCAHLMLNSAGRWLLFKLGYRIAGLRMRGDLSGMLLLDSGVLQPPVTFEVEYNFTLTQWKVEKLLGSLPLPSCALYVRVDPGLAMQRYLKRERKFGRSISTVRMKERFAQGFQTAERLYKTCLSIGVPCMAYDNEEPISRVKLRDIIKVLSNSERRQ